MPCPLFPELRHMKMSERAAQFAPFAALNGFEEEIDERARFTDSRRFTDEGKAAIINERLQQLAEGIKNRPEAMITGFRPDRLKSGGAYITGVYKIRKIDEFERQLITVNGEKINIDDIFDIELL